jgi:hypothetical protein
MTVDFDKDGQVTASDASNPRVVGQRRGSVVATLTYIQVYSGCMGYTLLYPYQLISSSELSNLTPGVTTYQV